MIEKPKGRSNKEVLEKLLLIRQMQNGVRRLKGIPIVPTKDIEDQLKALRRKKK